jgi:hypothetical protein
VLITHWILGQNAPFEVWGSAGPARQMEKLLDCMRWERMRIGNMNDLRRRNTGSGDDLEPEGE